jgi:hypothetical protein
MTCYKLGVHCWSSHVGIFLQNSCACLSVEACYLSTHISQLYNAWEQQTWEWRYPNASRMKRAWVCSTRLQSTLLAWNILRAHKNHQCCLYLLSAKNCWPMMTFTLPSKSLPQILLVAYLVFDVSISRVSSSRLQVMLAERCSLFNRISNFMHLFMLLWWLHQFHAVLRFVHLIKKTMELDKLLLEVHHACLLQSSVQSSHERDIYASVSVSAQLWFAASHGGCSSW